MDIITSERLSAAAAASEDSPHLFRARLARVNGQSLLFSASQRAVYGLNESAAELWRWLSEGATAAEAGRRLAARGLDPSTAEDQVRCALADWKRLGLILPRRDDIAPVGSLVSRRFTLVDIRVRITFPTGCAEAVMPTLRHLEACADAADVHLEFLHDGFHLHLFRNGAWLAACRPEEVPPVLRAQLLAEVLEHSRYVLALHAASMSVGDRILLLCGPPGAGKTTLTLGLASAGFHYCADDVTLLDAASMCTGVPLAPAVKRGAWSVLETRCANLSGAPVFRRPDGRRVRYPVLDELERARPMPAAWIVLLDRSPGTRARLASVEPADALRSLLADAYAPERHLTDPAFDALVGAIERAEVRRLVYADLEDAVDALRDWCR